MILDRGYLDHWKTNLLRQLTGLPHASELPIRLWEYCEARRDDFIEDRDGLVIAGICRAGIEPKALLSALMRCRFIVKAPRGFKIHGWRERNNGWLAKIEAGQKRAIKAQRGTDGKLLSDSCQLAGHHAGSIHPASDKNHQLAGQLAGDTAGPVEWSGVEKSTEPADTPQPLRADVSVRERVKSETWAFILGLFGTKKRRPGYEADNALARQIESLPLSEEQRELLSWHYGLPHDPKDIDLRARFGDADKLAINLFAAIERAEAYAKKTGRTQKKAAAVAEPAGWREAMAAEFPGAEMPATWEEFQALGASIRKAVMRRLEGGAA